MPMVAAEPPPSRRRRLWRPECRGQQRCGRMRIVRPTASRLTQPSSHPSPTSRWSSERNHGRTTRASRATTLPSLISILRSLVVLNDELLDADFDASDNTSHELGPLGGSE